ncbi:MAG: ABC transporter substrate-binding protein [Dehalococcoidia bacterium]
MSDFESRYWRRRVSRRGLIRGGLMLGGGLASAALFGCGPASSGGGESAATKTPVTSAGGSAGTTAVKQGGKLRVGLPGGPTLDSLDSSRTTGTWTHLESMTIFDTLLVESEDKKLVGSLAESWESAPDNLSVVMKLRKGVKFADGNDFKSADVKYLMDRVRAPDNSRALAFGYIGPTYTGTELIDDYTAKINLSAPNFTMLRRLTRAYLGVPSRAAAEKAGNDEFARKPIGSGPFTLTEWVNKDRVVVKKHAQYNWAPSIFAHQGAAYLDEIDFIEVPDQESRASALEAGDIDVMEEVPPVAVDRLLKDSRFRAFNAVPQGQTYLLRINTKKAPTDDVRVRQAINHAVNKTEILKLVYFNLHKPSNTVLTSSSFGFDGSLNKYPNDKAKAAALLDAAGWKVGAGGLREKDGQKLELSYYSTFKDVAEVVQIQLKEIGVGVNIVIVAAGTDSDNRGRQAIDHLNDGGTQQAGFLNEDPDVMRADFHSSGIKGGRSGTVFMGYEDAKLDDVLTKSQQLPDRSEERAKLLRDAQSMIMDAAIVVPIFDGVKYLIAKKNVNDLKMWPVNFYTHFYDANLV